MEEVCAREVECWTGVHVDGVPGILIRPPQVMVALQEVCTIDAGNAGRDVCVYRFQSVALQRTASSCANCPPHAIEYLASNTEF